MVNVPQSAVFIALGFEQEVHSLLGSFNVFRSFECGARGHESAGR